MKESLLDVRLYLLLESSRCLPSHLLNGRPRVISTEGLGSTTSRCFRNHGNCFAIPSDQLPAQNLDRGFQFQVQNTMHPMNKCTRYNT